MMRSQRTARRAVAGLLTSILIAGLVVAAQIHHGGGRTHLVAYFDNANGLFVGDEVRILGVPVGKVAGIEAQPEHVKVSFWVDDDYPVPADVKAVVLSPALVTARAIQLTPVYSDGPTLADHSIIPQERTVVPIEWDQVRAELGRLVEMLQPSESGGTSPLGNLISTSAEDLRGNGATIRTALVEMSAAISALGDHSGDLFGTIKHLSVLVGALRDSDTVLRHLNQNLAAASSVLANDTGEVGEAVTALAVAATDVQGFVAENRDALGLTTDKLTSVSAALNDSLDDVKQLLHMAPTVAEDFVNIYQPAQGTLSGALSTNNLSDPISFICSAIQAASREGAEQSAKLCVQYLAPIIKNRQYNFFPLGENLFVGASARPNELTYSEDWLRPDHIAARRDTAAAQDESRPGVPHADEMIGAEPTDPSAGLAGMMVPQDGGA
ncbi:MCE family protein [Mycobacterium sp. 1274756.6]|uniref:MCE family protein n=1 Tax=Mycobacterium sp. 1274756.6 TaxID=1834076 RepID=UPI000800673D|nr:MCE family protein [Mycobacterium sp. 1274756.6]OBJ70685.1 mammalian cell entry protein [Mycobacterium sp. 1274756.6]